MRTRLSQNETLQMRIKYCIAVHFNQDPLFVITFHSALLTSLEHTSIQILANQIDFIDHYSIKN